MKQLSLILAALTVAGSATAMPQKDAVRHPDKSLTTRHLESRSAKASLNGGTLVAGKAMSATTKTRTRAEESDIPLVIDQQPEGTLATYSRSGYGYMVFWGDISATTQDDMVLQMVTAPDGKTVYIQDPISSALANTWVKGTKEGNKITIPAGQCILYDENEGYGIEMYAGSYREVEEDGEVYYYYEKDESVKEFTYTIGNDGVISLDAPFDSDADGYEVTPDNIVTAFYSDDNQWAGYADWKSVYTPFTEKAAVLPEGAETSSYVLSYKYVDYSTEEFVVQQKMTTVGVKDNTVYLVGINLSEPQNCAVGTIQGDKVVFQGHQYIGLDYGYLTYFETATYEIVTIGDEETGYKDLEYTQTDKAELTYDAATKGMTAPDGVAFLLISGPFDDPMFSTDGELLAPAYNLFKDVAATPQTPEIMVFEDAYEEMGECGLQCYVPVEDVDGGFIDSKQLYYIIYTMTDGVEKPYTFTAEKYPGIDGKEITEVPYLLDLYDDSGFPTIGQGGVYIALFEPAADDYGIQSVYYGGGERKESPINWYYGGSGVKDVNVEGSEVKAIYGIDGVRRSETTRGINIIRMSDSSVRKLMVR